MVKKSLFRGKKAYATVSPVLEIATLNIKNNFSLTKWVKTLKIFKKLDFENN